MAKHPFRVVRPPRSRRRREAEPAPRPTARIEPFPDPETGHSILFSPGEFAKIAAEVAANGEWVSIKSYESGRIVVDAIAGESMAGGPSLRVVG